MGFDAVTYAMAKSYTNSVIDSGGGGGGGTVNLKNLTVTLLSDNWASLQQRINIEEVDVGSTVLVSPVLENRDEVANFGIFCAQQEENALVFKTNVVPNVNIQYNICIL